MPDEFDVFLSHNSQDKPVVEEIAVRLRARGLRVWLDKWELRPGFPWQEGLEEGVRASRAVAVFVGASGLGAWEEPEMRAFIARSRREKIPVIPVLLPGCPDSPQLSLFLEALTWVDLREGVTEEGFAQLVWGITGKKGDLKLPVAASATANGKRRVLPLDPKTWRARWSWGVGLFLLGVLLTLGAWLWPRSSKPLPAPKTPEIYAVRVQVLDPQGRPVGGTKVRTSAGNEPQLLPDGWWEIEIPAAKAPIGGRISIWADHEAWEGNGANLRLSDDPNPRVEIRLKEPKSWIRGRVVDSSDQALEGVRVTPKDGTSGVATTDVAGRFALMLPRPRETRIRLQAVRAPLAPGDVFCYTGRENCSIILEKK
jgi:TIR domain-containing protein